MEWMTLTCVLVSASLAAPPVVHSPIPEEVSREFGIAPFYEQCVMVGRFPVVSSAEVHDEALQEAAFLIGVMTAQKPEMLDALANSKTRFTIMAPTEMTTVVPEHSDLTPAAYWDKRARGLGATRQRPAVSCGEENLLCFKGDPYGTENILIHEFAHALHQMALDTVDPTFDDRVKSCYSQALEEGIWEGTYAATNRMEYWAEIVQSYYDTNRVNDHDHNDVDTREELAAYDPRGHALCVEVFGADAPRYQRPFDREVGSVGTEHLAGWDREVAPRFQWPPEVIQAWDRHQAQTLTLRPKDGESELEHLKRKAASEDPAALVELGWRHREGEGVEQSDELAVVYYRRAALKGDPAGEDSYGWMLKTGRGVDRNDQEAVLFFRRSAEGGFAQGMFNLALMLKEGRGVPAPNLQEAAIWLQRASTKGHSSSTEELEKLRR